jgi:ribose transport system substrate-binding protein
MDEAVKQAAEKKGDVEVISTDANGDAAKLTSDVEDLVARGVDGLIISAGPLESAPAALNSAEQAGIPVVLVDRKLADGNYTSWIGPDNEAIGRQDGEFLAGQPRRDQRRSRRQHDRQCPHRRDALRDRGH